VAGAQGARLDRLGVGLFTIPTMLERDFAGTMRTLAAIGYKEVETFGPYPFSAASAQERWKTVSASLNFRGSGYFGLTAREVKAILDGNGLTSPSMHTDLDSLREKLEPMAEAAHVIGQQYVVLPAIPAEDRRNLDDYKRMADEFNRIGKRAVGLGLRFAYHNHGYGLVPMEGRVPFEVIAEGTDKAMVDLQMDLYWTAAGGADPIAYLRRFAGRYVSVHVKDMAKRVRFTGDGGDSAQWIELFPYIADAGAGVLDLAGILAEARRSGVRHFFLERDQTPTPDETLRASYRYLSGLRLS
jgi:sugar phosphate isomerase/epimerase